MKNFLVWIKYRISAFIRFYLIKKKNSAKKYSETRGMYVGKKILSAFQANEYIFTRIVSKNPFLVGRFGSTELLNMQTNDFGVYGKYNVSSRFEHLCNWSGFFPKDVNLLPNFAEVMKDSLTKINLLAVWFHPFEDYYIKHFMDDVKITYLLDLEPWSCPEHPWSSALKGKKVLVIHPFEETIKSQYARRAEIFPGTDILPEFELKTLKAVQTIAGEKDERFDTWFDALEWMYQEAMKIDFDVAIIGCGAYGLPLAAKLKQAGKQAIHLAGATQLLFGIKGKRWEENPAFEYVRKYFNEAWVYPSDTDKVKNGDNVEGGCYWK